MKPFLLLFSSLILSTVAWGTAPGSIVPTDHDGRVNSIFSDPIAYRVGENITVVVNLNSAATASRSLTSAKNSAINEGSIASPMIPSELVNNYGLSMSGNTSHSGVGNLADNQTLTTTFTGKIVEILPNGTYKIEANRKFTVGKEKSELTLTGIVRSWDIGATNTINSTLIADLQVEQKGTGPLSRSTDKGWLVELYEFLAPF